MLDDDAEYEQRRQIRAQADADVAAFIESLGQDEGSGVPPPPTIKVSEVSSQPVELDFIGFGQQGSGTAPGAGTSPGSNNGACCHEFDPCEDLTESGCISAGGTFQGVGTSCGDEGICSQACCHRDGTCTDITRAECVSLDGQSRGLGSICEFGQCGTCCLDNECDPGFVVCGTAGAHCGFSQDTLDHCNEVGGTFVDGASEASCNDNSCCEPPISDFTCCTTEQFCCDFGGSLECSNDPCE
jgi:hypothetical protein